MSRILLLGARGQVGSALAARDWGGHDLVALGSHDLDLTQASALRRRILAEKPALVINAAAYTAVDKAETEAEAARAMNALAPAAIAAACAEAQAALIHFSTDYVFDGTKPGPYLETDAPAPLNVYGASKLAGEAAVAAALARHLIFRVSWVFSATGANFLRTMLRLAKERPEIRVVDDQIGAPTFAGHAADIAALTARRILGGDPAPWGLYHYADAPDVSWHGFASEILARAHARGWPLPKITAISAAEYGGPTKRPASSRLDTSKFEAAFGEKRRDWRLGVAAALDRLLP